MSAGPRKDHEAPVADAAGADGVRHRRAEASRPFRRSAGLTDGTPIVIRDVRRRDRALIESGFANLSARSRFLRFFGGKAALTKAELDRLTDPADHDHVALGALALGPSGGPAAPVGIGRFVRLAPGGAEAELALTVIDRFQGRGAGTLLLEALSEKAARCGISAFVAHVHTENDAMRALARRYGAERTSWDRDEAVYRLPVASVLRTAQES